MKDTVIAVCGADAGTTPIMPFLGERLDSKDFTALAKLKTETALLRCGIDILDICKAVTEPQEVIFQANRGGADYIIVISYDAFGSRKSFNDVHGATVRYFGGRHGDRSRVLAEDICAKLGPDVCGTAKCEWAWAGAACPVAVVCAGYLTHFDEAKRSADPDFAEYIAEHAVMGICEYLGIAYIPVGAPSCHAELCDCSVGKRGKRVKLLQTLLAADGYDVAIDGIYGRATDMAVKAMCINNGIEGIADICGSTSALLECPAKLGIGSKHRAVLYAQRKLRSKLYKVPLNGELDANTIAAVNDYSTETANGALSAKDEITVEHIRALSPIGGGRPRLF